MSISRAHLSAGISLSSPIHAASSEQMRWGFDSTSVKGWCWLQAELLLIGDFWSFNKLLLCSRGNPRLNGPRESRFHHSVRWFLLLHYSWIFPHWLSFHKLTMRCCFIVAPGRQCRDVDYYRYVGATATLAQHIWCSQKHCKGKED